VVLLSPSGQIPDSAQEVVTVSLLLRLTSVLEIALSKNVTLIRSVRFSQRYYWDVMLC